MLRKIIICLFLPLIIFGCAYQTEKELKTAVNDYNRTLIAVLSSGSIDLLNSVATDKEVRRMHLFLSNLNGENKLITADLLSMMFKSVEIKPPFKPEASSTQEFQEAYVKTEEIWTYKYLNSSTKNIIEGPYKIKYNTRYHVVKLDDKWVVNDVYFQENILK
jgi:hypothetical protein